jgi:S-adenosylmethionine decarboxylase proenzyme
VRRKLKSLGRHILVEFHGCNKEKINDLKFVESAMIGAAEYAKATVVDGVFHKFNPHGISGVVVIAESHLAIHTWPEYGYAAVDLFTCGEEVDPWDSFFYLNKKFEAESNTTMELKRGLLDVPNLKTKVDYKEKAFTASVR